MKKILVTVLCAALGGSCLAADNLSAEAGLAYVNISGVRAYSATGSGHKSETSGVLAPFVRYTNSIPDWDLSLGYMYIRNLKWMGLSPTTDIFHDGGPSSPTVTAFGATEKIHEFSVDARYVLSIRDGLCIGFGPTVSAFLAQATIAGRSFSDSEFKLGASVRVKYQIKEKLEVGVGYRYATPSGRRLNSLTVDAGFRF